MLVSAVQCTFFISNVHMQSMGLFHHEIVPRLRRETKTNQPFYEMRLQHNHLVYLLASHQV